MRTLSKREMMILAATVILALLFIVTQVIVKPMSRSGQGVEHQTRLKKGRLAQAQGMLDLAPKVNERYQHLLSLAGYSRSAQEDAAATVERIESAANQTHVRITNMQPQSAVNQRNVIFVPVALEVNARWEEVAQFLYILQAKPNYYFINELNVEKMPDQSGTVGGRLVLSRLLLSKP